MTSEEGGRDDGGVAGEGELRERVETWSRTGAGRFTLKTFKAPDHLLKTSAEDC